MSHNQFMKQCHNVSLFYKFMHLMHLWSLNSDFRFMFQFFWKDTLSKTFYLKKNIYLNKILVLYCIKVYSMTENPYFKPCLSKETKSFQMDSSDEIVGCIWWFSHFSLDKNYFSWTMSDARLLLNQLLATSMRINSRF